MFPEATFCIDMARVRPKMKVPTVMKTHAKETKNLRRVFHPSSRTWPMMVARRHMPGNSEQMHAMQQ